MNSSRLTALALIVTTLGLLSAAAADARSMHSITDLQVQQAAASLRDDADSAFVTAWQQLRDNEYVGTIQASDVRAAELWILLGNSIGMCRNHVSNKTMADWMAAFDRLSIGISDPDLREHFRGRGFKAIDDGEKFAAGRLSDAEAKRTICKTEIAAVQQILSNPF